MQQRDTDPTVDLEVVSSQEATQEVKDFPEDPRRMHRVCFCSWPWSGTKQNLEKKDIQAHRGQGRLVCKALVFLLAFLFAVTFLL